eukprot:TRINITY_DN1782_c0_g1_i1.p1 TRINITY_DN1782_c0_g1~~TRINITY_DN1782_c0_g1_i1.p1  ORF type:complete len:154 (+),score=28.03 TRINITY_DN1782_c0_g1_i1:63-524(+)
MCIRDSLLQEKGKEKVKISYLSPSQVEKLNAAGFDAQKAICGVIDCNLLLQRVLGRTHIFGISRILAFTSLLQFYVNRDEAAFDVGIQLKMQEYTLHITNELDLTETAKILELRRDLVDQVVDIYNYSSYGDANMTRILLLLSSYFFSSYTKK